MNVRRNTSMLLAALLILLAGCGRVSTPIVEDGGSEPAVVATQELSWVVEEVDALREVSGHLSIALDGSASPHIAYYADKPGEFGYGVRYAFVDEDGVWQTEPVGDAVNYAQVSMALDSSGRPHVVYIAENPDTAVQELVHVARTSAGWSVPEVIATYPAGPLSMMLDASDTPHVGFTAGSDLKYAVRNAAGDWSLATVASAAQQGYLALDSLGQPHAVYADAAYVSSPGPSFALTYAYPAGSGAWVSETVDSDLQTGFFASLAFDGNDHPHVGYITSAGALRFASRGSDGWSTPQDIQDAPKGLPSIAVDGSGNPRIAFIGWDDANQYVLKYASYADGWSVETVVGVFGTTMGDMAVSLTLDAGDRPHIAYVDATDLLAYAALAEPTGSYVVTNGNDAGEGSLRQMLLDAPAGTTITFAPEVTAVNLTSGSLVLDKDVTIAGPEDGTVTIRGDGATFRVIYIGTAGVQVTLRNLTITDGYVNGSSGGGIAVEAWDWDLGTVPSPSLRLERCSVVGNYASQGGGGLSIMGDLFMDATTVSGNVTGAYGWGGGLVHYGTDLSQSVAYPSAATIVNSTISGNTAYKGGAIDNEYGSLRILFSTITGNTATSATAGGILSWNDSGTRTTLKGTIVVGNTASGAADDVHALDTTNRFDSRGYNVIGVGTGEVDFTQEFTATGDLTGVAVADAGLLALGDYGGPTQTHALTSGSVAANHVPTADCTDLAGATLPTDQRGVARPQGSACESGAFEYDAAVTEYVLDVTVAPEGSGTVTGAGSYASGASAELTAAPAAHWVFSHWSGDLGGDANPATLTMDANKTVVANFTQVLYPVTESIVGDGGSVQRVPDGVAYPYGTIVTVTAVPTDEWHFDHWTGAVTGSSLSGSFEVIGAMAYTAHFTQWYPLTTAIVGEGGVARNPSGEFFEPGTPVTLTATPMPGSRFDHWSGDLTGSANPETVTMNAAKTVTATFVPDTYTVTTRVEGAGSVDGDGTYPAGAEVTLTPTPDAGWTFVGWTGDVISTDDPLVLILKGDLDIVATFAPVITYTVDVTIEGGGKVDLDPEAGPYEAGSTVSLTPVADAGWHFDHWSGDLTEDANPATLTMDANKAVTATFVQDTVTYTVTTHVDGDGEVLGGGTYADGATATLTAVADPGALFDHWSGDAEGSNATIELTVTSNLDVTAHFVATGHTLDVTAQGEGYVVVEPSPGPYADGTAVTLEAISASGWYFQGWTGAITSPANPVTLEMHDSMAITANFLPEVGPLVTVALDGLGHVTSVPEGIDCGTTGGVCRASFPRNTKLTLTGVADDGAAFLRWTGTVPGIEPDLNVRLREDVTVTAHFVALNGAEVAIDPVGSFRGNTAVVTGSLVCESDSYDLDVSIVQVVPVKKGEPVRVSASATVIGAVCGQPWMATLVADTDRFTRGEAEVTVIVDGDTRTRTIELR